MPNDSSTLSEHLVCVRCAAALELTGAAPRCQRCSQPFGYVGQIPILLPRVDDHLSLWRGQLATLQAQAQHTRRAIEAELETPGLLESGRARLRALGDA